MKALRPHQSTAIDLLRNSLRAGKRRPILQAATGFGKTLVAANIIRTMWQRGKRVAFVVDAISLIDQTVQSFVNEGLMEIGVIQASHPLENWHMPIQVCSVQTLQRRGMPETDIVIIDECHVRSEWLHQWLAEHSNVIAIGLSATPWAKGLGLVYDDLIQPITMQELIDQGYLCPFRVFAASKPDLGKVKTVAGEYHEGQLSSVMQDEGLVADVVETWLRSSERRRTLVFAVDCAHAQKLQERFAAAGVSMGYVDAYTERLDRKKLNDRLRRGEIAGIVSVGTMVKGVDIPEVACISDCAPTKSEMRYVQKFGRGLRIDPLGTADCIYLDHASNTVRLGFPTDIRHDKLCTKKPGEKADSAEREPPKPAECPQCKRLRPKGVRVCPSCGFEAKRMTEVEEREGELREVKKPTKQLDMLERDRFYQEMRGLAAQKGKQDGWAWHATRQRYGSAPRDKLPALPPSPATVSWIRSQQIRRAKAMQKHA